MMESFIYMTKPLYDIPDITNKLKANLISLTNDQVLQLLDQLDDDKIELQEKIEHLESIIEELRS